MKPNREKIRYTVSFFAICCSLLFNLNSCDENKMDWGRDPSYGEVTTAELPLALAEKISRYELLKTYTDFTLGMGVGMDLYMNNETYRNIVNQNFDEVVAGYAMKHGAMVNSQGELSFGPVDAFIGKAKEAGLSVYGHTLVWHQNQNAGYLNGLIAPTIVPGPAGSNALDLSGLQDGSFTGWNKTNPGAGIEVVDGAGLSATAKAVKLISSSSSSGAWNLQLISPDITIVSGHNYEVSFYIKSEQAGKGRISFSGLSNNYPWKDWYNTGGGYTEAFETSSVWRQVKFTVNDFTESTFKMAFDLGYLPDVTYYIDIDNIIVVDLDAEPVEVNYVENGGFETGDLSGWTALNPGAGTLVTNEDKFLGDYSVKMTSGSSSSSAWDLQLESSQLSLDASKVYTFSFNVKSTVAGKGRISFPGGMNGNQYPWMNWTGSGASEAFNTPAGVWTAVSVEMTNTTNVKLSFDMGYLPDVTYYIDDVKIVEKPANGVAGAIAVSSGPVIIEKTDEEKAQIIGAALEDWISKMVGHYKADVHAWDVVNEPMNESGSVRDGNVAEPASDEFHWVKYLGQDYAVTAFNLARQYGNPGDKLFINDYNLEYSLEKCDGLIQYVGYIESKGATVDGIGTQMHLSIDSDKEKIAQMFQKLAATGKLIKITEFDIKVGTTSPTEEQFAKQAELYRYVLDKYMQYIPAAQRYGVAVWGVSDNAEEHVNWIPDDAPNLWNADYERKHAYKGFADGLAGRDVSEDFTGELQY